MLFGLSAYAINPLVFPLMLLGAGFVLVVFYRPHLGVAGAFLLVSLENTNLPLPTGALSPTEGALILVGFVWICRALVRPDTVALPQLRDAPLFLLLFCVAIGLSFAADIAPVFRVLLVWTLFVCVYFQAQSFTLKQMRLVIACLIVGAGVLGLIGTVQYLQTGGAAAYEAAGARAAGTFVEPNYFASLMQLALLPALALILTDMRRNFWMLPLWGAALAGLAFSLSRGGAMGFAVGLLVLLLWRRARWLAVGITVLFAVLTIANANPLVQSEQFGDVTKRLQTVTQLDQESSTNSRPRIWALARELAAEHPFFGIGVNQFQSEAAVRGLYERGVPLENAHMIPLSLAAELGLIGLAAFAWLVGQWGVRALRVLRSADPLARAIALGLAASIVGFLVQGLTAAQIRDNLLMGTFLVFGGMITGLADRASKESGGGVDVRNAPVASGT